MNEETTRPDTNIVLADITSALVGHFKMSTLLDQVVETSMRTLHAEVCSIFLEDKQTEPGVLTMMAGSGFARKLVGKAKYRIGEAFTGTIAHYGRRFNIKSREQLENLEVDGGKVWIGKFDQEQWPSMQSEFRNCIALPLKIKDQILGVMKVENKDLKHGDHFTEEDERYVETIANVVALAIENARLHEQTEKQLKTIAAKAAHRINNQVTNYDGIELELLDQIQSPVPDKQKLQEITKRVAETTKSLKKMVGEFKGYGKPLVIEKDYCNINKIVEDEVWLAKPPIGIRISKQLDINIPPIPLDAGRFAEAVKELLSNSIKAISNSPINKSNGEISISTQLVEQSIANDRVTEPMNHVLVVVQDNGPGFPLNFPIFEPFQSTDTQSTGLGLATVKELAEAHGGQIEASHQKHGGTLIKISIPC